MDESAGFRTNRVWLLVLLGLLVGQGWLTLRLFTPDLSFQRLLNDEPILSGQHPLHLYHGQLAAKTWRERGTSSCYDPAFQAGYPKTPVFDPGSRPAELFLLAARGSPAAYKVGLALCCLLVPAGFALMGRGIGLPAGSCCLAGLLGGIVWWSPPIRALIDGGDLDVLLGGMCMLVLVCWLVRYSEQPGMDAWLVLTLAAALGWYVQPLFVAGFLPLAMLCYVWVATRHGLVWHLALVAATVVAFVVNYAWLSDWFRYLWVRLPFGDDAPPLPSKPLKHLLEEWRALVPSDSLNVAVGLGGLLGLFVIGRRHAGTAAALLLSAVGLFIAGAAGKVWQPLHELGTGKILPLIVWCAVLPCAAALAALARHLGGASGWRPLGAVWLVAGLLGAAWAIDLPRALIRQPRLRMGLNPERVDLIAKLTAQTDGQGRILLEERGMSTPDACWTALLAERTGRHFLGGLAPGWDVEHLFVRLEEGKLAGRPINEWSDVELERFCDRYNVLWVVCWSPEAQASFRKLPMAHEVSHVSDGDDGVLFRLERKPTFFLRGQGQVVQMDWQRVALCEVTPDEDGYVVLSLHHLSGWRIAPSYVQMEREYDPVDPIALIRLKVPGPVARLTLTWENP